MTASPGYRFPFAPVPVGWYRVASSADLPVKGVLPLHLFQRDLVLFRTESGRPRLMDAHCPHLGAHLGHGGRVCGEELACPFHGWRFSGADGACAHAGQDRPPAVGVRAWPTTEVNSQIMAWYHPNAEAPTWGFPELPEGKNPSWTGFRAARSWKVRTHVQEICENGMDNAHFTWLHTQQTMAMRTEEVTIEGHILTHHTWQRFNLFGVAKLMVEQVQGPLDVQFQGLGIVVNRATVHANITLEYVFVFYATPIDEEHIELSSFLSVKRTGGRLVTRLLWMKAAHEGGVTIDQDVPIWENKAYRPRPLLLQHDGPIPQFRRWTQQFYPNTDVGSHAAK